MGRETISRAIDGIYPAKVLPPMPWTARFAGDDYGLTADPDWRAVDWRRHLHWMEIDGARVSYVDLGGGAGPPVVFVHGLGGNWQNFLENLPRTARDRRVLAMDLPGFGNSELPPEPITISGYGRFVDAFCERLDLGPVAIVGSSMGGFIGAEVAIAFPERTDRLALVGAAGISITNLRRRPTLTAARFSTLLGVGEISAAHARDVVKRSRLRYLALSAVVRHPNLIQPELAFELVSGAGKPGYVSALEALMTYDFRDRLPEIGCPTLVVWGSDDMMVPVRDADEFERLIPDARKLVMADTGHGPMFERPETFNRHMLDFLFESGEASQSESEVA